MGLFFITFFLLYSGLHLYVFLKAWHAFHFQWSTGTLIGLLFIVMIISPLIVRFLERGGHDALARFMAYAGYSWLGLLFFFFTLSVSLDVVRFLAFVTGGLLK